MHSREMIRGSSSVSVLLTAHMCNATVALIRKGITTTKVQQKSKKKAVKEQTEERGEVIFITNAKVKPCRISFVISQNEFGEEDSLPFFNELVNLLIYL